MLAYYACMSPAQISEQLNANFRLGLFTCIHLAKSGRSMRFSRSANATATVRPPRLLVRLRELRMSRCNSLNAHPPGAGGRFGGGVGLPGG